MTPPYMPPVLHAQDEPIFTEPELHVFINALDSSDNIEVTDWEAQFIDTVLVTRHLSQKQQNVIKSLIGKYGHRVKWSH